MNKRGFAALAVLAILGAAPARAEEAPAPNTAAAAALRIIYLSREGDAAYLAVQADDGVIRAAAPEPSPGAELALKDIRPTAHATGLTFTLERRTLPGDAPVESMAASIATSGALAVIADVPLADLAALAKALPATALPVFNIRHPDDALRRDFCATGLFHIAPSTAMLTDALAQFVVRRNWRDVLVLHGPLPADAVLADAFGVSAKKFGARVVASKTFIAGNDPRKRDQTDVALLTAGPDYDVVFLADTTGDFGRFVPFELARPRPVIGTEGLRAGAWDPLAERFGAPQVNHRFVRFAHRDMTQADWAAWVAVRAVAEAAIRGEARTGPAVAAALTGDAVVVDVSKGVQSSFRPWDRQLRQTIMLSSGDAVIAYAPLDGFLHQRTPLDTLGLDLPESPCRPK